MNPGIGLTPITRARFGSPRRVRPLPHARGRRCAESPGGPAGRRVDQHGPVHLPGKADRFHGATAQAPGGEIGDRARHRGAPDVRILLGPARPRAVRHIGAGRARDRRAALIDEKGFEPRSAAVQSRGTSPRPWRLSRAKRLGNLRLPFASLRLLLERTHRRRRARHQTARSQTRPARVQRRSRSRI